MRSNPNISDFTTKYVFCYLGVYITIFVNYGSVRPFSKKRVRDHTIAHSLHGRFCVPIFQIICFPIAWTWKSQDKSRHVRPGENLTCHRGSNILYNNETKTYPIWPPRKHDGNFKLILHKSLSMSISTFFAQQNNQNNKKI